MALVGDVSTVQLVYNLIWRFDYNTVDALPQGEIAEGGDIYVDFSRMDHHQRW